jgi:hypothetical protein
LSLLITRGAAVLPRGAKPDNFASRRFKPGAKEAVGKLNYRAPKRVPTRPKRAAKERTLEEKARRSQVKRLRSKTRADD